MFAPDVTTHELAGLVQRERLSHAALLQKVARERSPEHSPIDRNVQRRITARRLAATVGGAMLSISVAALAVAAL